MLSCSEIYRRFTGGFARNRGLLGHAVRTVRSMQNLQMPCPARVSAKSLIWRVGTSFSWLERCLAVLQQNRFSNTSKHFRHECPAHPLAKWTFHLVLSDL